MPNSAKKIVCLQLNEIEDIQEIPLLESINYTLENIVCKFAKSLISKL